MTGPQPTEAKGRIVAEPFIFIGTHRIKEGKLESFKQYIPGFMEIVEANEPRMLYFGAYFNEDGTEVAIVQVHPDADSMEFHMQVVGEHIRESYEEFLIDTKSIQIYGTPSDAALETMRQLAGSGVPVSIKSDYRGFNRLPATGVSEPAT
jgi:hypothetical protein